MLEGSKPLAAFVDSYPSDAEYEVIPERHFDPHVAAGRFLKREKTYSDQGEDGTHQAFRRVLYAQVKEAWRIDAYLLLHETVKISGWNEGFERMEGTLLGYEQWQNDVFLSTVWSKAEN
jgi:hypothetical protein